MFSNAKTAVLSAVQRLIDDQITKRVAPYLATGEFEGEVRSDVVVNDRNDISIVNCVARPSAVDALLAENQLPFHVITASCTLIHIDIPWDNLTTGDWVLTIEGLSVVIAPKEREYWSLSDVRAVKERIIKKDFDLLLKRLKELTEKAPRPSLFQTLVRKFTANMKPTINLKDVHLRFERLGDVAVPYSFGFIMSAMEVRSDTDEEGLQQTEISLSGTGLYCRTLQMGSKTVLPDGHDAHSFATEAEPEFHVISHREKQKKYDREKSRAPIAAEPLAPLPRFASKRSRSVNALTEDSRMRQHDLTDRFFRKHDAVAREMRRVLECAKSEWTSADWLLGPLQIAEGDAVVDVQQAHKNEPEQFDYETPINVMRIRLGRVAMDATEEQLGAFLSISAFRQSYHLWSMYATRRLELDGIDRPRRGPTARKYWQVAREAVVASLRKGGVNASNLAAVLEGASRYKKLYFHVLSEAVNPELDADVQAARELVALSQHALITSIQKLEDDLPAETLAWSRLVTLQRVREIRRLTRPGRVRTVRNSLARASMITRRRKESMTAASVAEASTAAPDPAVVEVLSEEEAPELEKVASHDDALASAVLEGRKSDDARIGEAPEGYVHRAVVLHLDAFVLRLLVTPGVEEQIDALGRSGGALGDGLLTVKVTSIDVRMRTMQAIGKSVHVAVGRVEVLDSVERGEGIARRVVDIEGDELGETPDEHLGGTPDHPGDILPFLLQRRADLLAQGCVPAEWGGFFGGRAQRRKSNSGASRLGSILNSSHHRDRHHSDSHPHHAHRANSGSRDPSPTMGTMGGESSGAVTPTLIDQDIDDRLPGTSPSPPRLGMLHLRQGQPAIRLFMLQSSPARVLTKPHELWLTLGKAEAHYLPAFFAKYDAWMRTLERVKYSSQLGGTAIMRRRFAKLTRSVNNVLAEKWHMPEAKMMMLFLSATDLFDLPSSTHAVNLCLMGGTLRLFSEKDAAEELLAMHLPQVHIARTPRIGDPTPPIQKAEIRFDGCVQITTPVVKNTLARVLQAQHAGTQGYSRMGGRLASAVYVASNEVSAYRERLRRLDRETEHLRVLFAALRSRSASSVLRPAVDVLAPSSVVDVSALLEHDRRETEERYAAIHRSDSVRSVRFGEASQPVDELMIKMDEILAQLHRQPRELKDVLSNQLTRVAGWGRGAAAKLASPSRRERSSRRSDRRIIVEEASLESIGEERASQIQRASGAVADSSRGPRHRPQLEIETPSTRRQTGLCFGCFGGDPQVKNVVVVDGGPGGIASSPASSTVRLPVDQYEVNYQNTMERR